VFNCEEKILESAATHEKELTEAEKNMDFEANELKKDLVEKFATGYRAGFEAAKSGGPAEPPAQKD
jgi:flagellar biosynthesis/type III secretory pathway protein FliH